MKINLDNFDEKALTVLAGREKGVAIRNRWGLDKIDKNQEQVEIMIPENLYSLNSSYFLGLFGPSVRSLGESRIWFMTKKEQSWKKYILSDLPIAGKSSPLPLRLFTPAELTFDPGKPVHENKQR
jgi:hypothetical protein